MVKIICMQGRPCWNWISHKGHLTRSTKVSNSKSAMDSDVKGSMEFFASKRKKYAYEVRYGLKCLRDDWDFFLKLFFYFVCNEF